MPGNQLSRRPKRTKRGGLDGRLSSSSSSPRFLLFFCVVPIPLVPILHFYVFVARDRTTATELTRPYPQDEGLVVLSKPPPRLDCEELYRHEPCKQIQCETWSKSWNQVNEVKRQAWDLLKCREKLKEERITEPVPRDGPFCPPRLPDAFIESSHRRIDTLKNKYRGQRCVLIANGPSLNDIRWDWQENFEVIMGMNKIWMGFERYNLTRMNYYACCNRLVTEQSRDEIWGGMMGGAGGNNDRVVEKFVRNMTNIFACNEDPSTRGIHFTPSRVNGIWRLKFSTDIREYISEGSTVTYWSLQVLFWIGCQEVIIIGMDHNYQQAGRKNVEQKLAGPDKNHFDSSYFSGHSWHLADLQSSESHYRLANDVYNVTGRKIIDATPGGKCNIFQKGDWKVELYKKQILASTR